MPRYVVERTFPGGVPLGADEESERLCKVIVRQNGQEGVTWIHSYVAADRRKTYCVYDAPNPEAIHSVAKKTGLPVDSVSEVRVLDPYFHR